MNTQRRSFTYLPNGFILPINGTKLFLVCPGQYLFVEDLCLLVLALLHVRTGQVVLRLGHVWIILSQLRLVDLQRPLVVHLHFFVLALWVDGGTERIY